MDHVELYSGVVFFRGHRNNVMCRLIRPSMAVSMRLISLPNQLLHLDRPHPDGHNCFFIHHRHYRFAHAPIARFNTKTIWLGSRRWNSCVS